MVQILEMWSCYVIFVSMFEWHTVCKVFIGKTALYLPCIYTGNLYKPEGYVLFTNIFYTVLY